MNLVVNNGLEYLLLCEKFGIKEAKMIVKTSLDEFKSSSFQLRSLMALNLISTSTYFGIIYLLKIESQNINVCINCF